MANLDDLRDDLDFAIEAIETARKTMPDNPDTARKMATTLLAAKLHLIPTSADISLDEVHSLINRATRYLDC